MQNISKSLVVALANYIEFEEAVSRTFQRNLTLIGPIHPRVATGCEAQLELFKQRAAKLNGGSADFTWDQRIAAYDLIDDRDMGMLRLIDERNRRKLEREAEIEFYRQIQLAA
jgi:hypothetical protein